MAKKILRVNAEGELIDSINPSIHFDISGGRGGITRKQVKEKAVNLANTWTGDLGTNQDYVEGNIYLQGNKRRQRLFDRTFNKQYGKNIDATIDKILLQSAKEGNVEAFQEHNRRKTNRVAPYFIPAVAGPAATIAAEAGVIGTLGRGAAKGLDLMGKAMMPSTWTNAFKLTKAGQLFPSLLDAGAISLYTTQGLKHAKQLWDDERYGLAIANGALAAVPLLHGMVRGAKSLLSNVNLKPTSYKTLEETVKGNKLYRKVFDTSNYRTERWNKYKKLRDNLDRTSFMGYDKVNEYDAVLAQGNWDKDGIVANLPITKKTIPNRTIADVKPQQEFLIIDGNKVPVNTTMIEEGIEGGAREIIDMSIPKTKFISGGQEKDLFTKRYLFGDYDDPNILISLNEDGRHVLQRPGIPDIHEKHVFDKYRHFIENTIGDSGALTGSTRLYGTHISGKPKDIEILTTKSRLNDVRNKLNFVFGQQLPKAISGRSIINGREYPTDIQVIDDVNGFATGDIANSIYTVLHPEKLAEIQRGAAGRIRMGYPKENGKYYTPEELLDEVKAKGLLDRVILVDALKVSKDYNMNPIKQNRPITLLTSDNPHTISEIKEVLKVLGKAQVGKDYKSFNDLYKVDFSDIDANKKFLQGIGFPQKFADNPEIMQNIAEYYHMQNSISMRNVNTTTIGSGETLHSGITTTTSRHGTVSGGGGNSVLAGDYRGLRGYGDIESISQYDIIPDKSKIKNLFDYYKQVDRLHVKSKLTPEEQLKIESDPLFKNRQIKTVYDLHKAAGDINSKEGAKFVAQEMGFPIIYNPNMGGVRGYVGRYSEQPITYSYKNADTQGYEFGRNLTKYYNSTKESDVIRTTVDSYEEAAAIKQIESLIKAKDFKALKELGIEVYDKQSLKALEKQIGEWEMRNFERMNKIWKNTSRTLDKIQITKNNLQSAAEILGIAGTTAGTIIAGMQKGHELKDKRYNDRISYYERNLIPYMTKEEIKNIEREKSAKKRKERIEKIQQRRYEKQQKKNK